MNRRALHFVFKIGNRSETAKFYRDILGMKFLRHEEFEEGCEASCNGPYDGKWSKSMIGYGAEDDHFVVELTYNYGIGKYNLGNDFLGITIEKKGIIESAKQHGFPCRGEDDSSVIHSPDGYNFIIVDKETKGDPVKKVKLACSNLERSINYWQTLLGMELVHKTLTSALFTYGSTQCHLELCLSKQLINRGSAFGRIAFSCPTSQLSGIMKDMVEAGETILKPLVYLETPGKATVAVVILADPDGHEICFVGDEAFKELSQVDKNAGSLISDAINNDKSDEWFAKKGRNKETV